MTRQQILQLIFHGAMLVLLGMVSGYIYRFAISSEWGPDQERTWRILHTFMVQCGGLYIAIGAVGRYLTLTTRTGTFVVWSLALSAYTFALGLVIAPLIGTRGLDPGSSLAAVAVFVNFVVSSAFGLAGVAVVVLGAFASLRRIGTSPRTSLNEGRDS